MKKDKPRRTTRWRLEQLGAKLPSPFIPRALTREVLPWLTRPEIIVLTGARQTGKSVILYELIFHHLLKKTNRIHYFNLDISPNLDFFKTPDHLIDLIRKNGRKAYIFIDEVQRLKEPGLFLKGISDLHLPVKIVVSGSSALELKSKVHEALTGRKIVFHVNPLNLSELTPALLSKHESPQALMNHLLTFGSYPAVALTKGNQFKTKLLEEIFQSYLEKDVKNFLKVENEMAFLNLVRILASQIGNLVNKEELSNTLNIHKNTLENYLFYLEQTFILDFVRPFHKNARKELLKSPKVYFRDLGLRNFAIQNFGDFRFRPDKGKLFENLVYLLLKNKLDDTTPIYFWRTKAGAEVNFVIQKGMVPIPIEVKATELKEPKVSKSLRSFLATYRPPIAYCVNLVFEGKLTINQTPIQFVTPTHLNKRFAI